jgi:hypothetical protein
MVNSKTISVTGEIVPPPPLALLAEVTAICVDSAADPPGPAQVRVNVVVAVKAPVICEPDVASAPLQPPDATQLLASVVVHVNVACWPLMTVSAEELSVIVGTGLTSSPYNP